MARALHRKPSITQLQRWEAADARAIMARDAEMLESAEQLSELARSFLAQPADGKRLLQHYQDVERLGSRGLLVEALVLFRVLVATEMKRPAQERDKGAVRSGLTCVTALIKELLALEDQEAQIKVQVEERVLHTYRELTVAIHEVLQSHPELLQRLADRLLDAVQPHAELPILEAEIVEG